MCLATIGVLAGLAGTAAGAVGAYQSAQAQNEAAEHNAEVATFNASVADRQSADAQKRGAQEEKRHRIEVGKMKGTQRSNLAASGVLIGQGSASDIISNTDFLGEQDAMTIRENTAREVWGHKNTASNYRSQSDLYSSQYSNPFLAAAPTLLSSTSSLASKYGSSKRSAGIGGGL